MTSEIPGSEPGDEVAADCTRELVDIARGDMALAEVLRASLRQLARRSTNPVLQEMAKEVLAGRISLREAATSDQYAHALFDKYGRFWERLKQRPDQQQRLVDSGQKSLEKIRGRLGSAEDGCHVTRELPNSHHGNTSRWA